MGTNYYMKDNHIGKLSHRWKFTFHATDNIRSYKDWLQFLLKNDNATRIHNENGNKITLEQFKKIVADAQLDDNNCDHSRMFPCQSYLDDEGYNFSDYEFS